MQASEPALEKSYAFETKPTARPGKRMKNHGLPDQNIQKLCYISPSKEKGETEEM